MERLGDGHAEENELVDEQGARPGGGAIALALMTACVPVAVAIAIFADLVGAFGIVLIVTAAIVASFGSALALRLRLHFTLMRLLIAGFACGAIVPLLLSALVRSWSELADWLMVFACFGLAGAFGAILAASHAVWLDSASVVAKVVSACVIAIGIAGFWLGPEIAMDRTCHNTLRDGRRSISPVAEFRIHAPMEDWDAVESDLRRYAKKEGWQVRADVRPDKGFPWFQVSLCRETGTQFFVTTYPFRSDTLSVHVTQPKGGDSWRLPFDELRDRLTEHWGEAPLEDD